MFFLNPTSTLKREKGQNKLGAQETEETEAGWNSPITTPLGRRKKPNLYGVSNLKRMKEVMTKSNIGWATDFSVRREHSISWLLL